MIRQFYEWSFSGVSKTALEKYKLEIFNDWNICCPTYMSPLIIRTLCAIKSVDKNSYNLVKSRIKYIFHADFSVGFGYVKESIVITTGSKTELQPSSDIWTNNSAIWPFLGYLLMRNAILAEAYQGGCISMLVLNTKLRKFAHTEGIQLEEKMNILLNEGSTTHVIGS